VRHSYPPSPSKISTSPLRNSSFLPPSPSTRTVSSFQFLKSQSRPFPFFLSVTRLASCWDRHVPPHFLLHVLPPPVHVPGPIIVGWTRSLDPFSNSLHLAGFPPAIFPFVFLKVLLFFSFPPQLLLLVVLGAPYYRSFVGLPAFHFFFLFFSFFSVLSPFFPTPSAFRFFMFLTYHFPPWIQSSSFLQHSTRLPLHGPPLSPCVAPQSIFP